MKKAKLTSMDLPANKALLCFGSLFPYFGLFESFYSVDICIIKSV